MGMRPETNALPRRTGGTRGTGRDGKGFSSASSVVASLVRVRCVVAITALLVTAAQAQAQPAKAPTKHPPPFGIGRAATPAEIAALDIDVGPDGAGLPAGPR